MLMATKHQKFLMVSMRLLKIHGGHRRIFGYSWWPLWVVKVIGNYREVVDIHSNHYMARCHQTFIAIGRSLEVHDGYCKITKSLE